MASYPTAISRTKPEKARSVVLTSVPRQKGPGPYLRGPGRRGLLAHGGLAVLVPERPIHALQFLDVRRILLRIQIIGRKGRLLGVRLEFGAVHDLLHGRGENSHDLLRGALGHGEAARGAAGEVVTEFLEGWHIRKERRPLVRHERQSAE